MKTICIPFWYDDETGENEVDQWLAALAYDYRSVPVSAWAHQPRHETRRLTDEDTATILANGAALAEFARAQAGTAGDNYLAFAEFIDLVVEGWQESRTPADAFEVETAAVAAPEVAAAPKARRPRRVAAPAK